MDKAYFTLSTPLARSNCARALVDAPDGTRVHISGPRRTIPQNDRMWAMLTDIANQKEHCGRRYDPNRWKLLFLHALGRETEFMPALDGRDFLPVSQSSSKLSTSEMSDMIELMFAWGAQNEVEWSDPNLPPGLKANPREAA